MIIVSEAVERASFAQTISANCTRLAFNCLKAAPLVLGSPNWIAPGADMEETYVPQAHDVIDAALINFFPTKRVNRMSIRNWDQTTISKNRL